MNVDKLQELADTLKKVSHFNAYANNAERLVGPYGTTAYHWSLPPDQFSLSCYFENVEEEDCGSVGCIIGYGIGITGGITEHEYSKQSLECTFSRRFELAESIVGSLGNPLYIFDEVQFTKITPEQAAEAVENVINGAFTEQDIWKHVLFNHD